MAVGYARIKSNKPGAVGVVLANGSTDTGISILANDSRIPASVLQGIFVDSIDTLGSVLVGASEGSVDLTFGLCLEGAGATVALKTVDVGNDLAALFAEARDCTKFGGKLRYKPAAATGYTEREIQAATMPDAWPAEAESNGIMLTALNLTVLPFSDSDGLDVVDEFTTDTLGTGGKYNIGGADWTKMSGSDALTVAGGIAKSSGVSSGTIYRHTGAGHSYSDFQVTMKVMWDDIAANAGFRLMLRHTDASNYLAANFFSDGAGAGTCRLNTVIDGTEATMATTAITTLAADTWYWIRARIEGNVVTAEWFTTEPTPLGAATHSATDAFTSTEAAYFGKGTTSAPAIRFVTAVSNYLSIQEFRLEAHNYRSIVTPEVISLGGEIPGDVEAKTDIVATATGSSASAAPSWACFAWMPQPATTNMIHNSGFETNVSGWVNTAVSGVQASASTSVTRVTSGVLYPGATALEIVCPATTDTGGNFPIYKRFKKGVKYIAECYAWSAAGTTVARVKLGVSGDLGTGSSLALNATPTRHAVSWTPTADVDTAYFAATIGAATATTWRIGRVMVYEAARLADVYADDTDLSPVFCMNDDGDGTVTDSIGGLAGTVNGNPTYGKLGPIPGHSGTTLDFDGTDDYVAFAYSATLNPAQVTCEAWVMRDVDTGGAEVIVTSLRSDGLIGYRLMVGATDLVEWRVGDGAAGSAINSVSTLSAGVWYHVLATSDGVTSKIYINGCLETAAADVYSPNTSADFRIGTSVSGSADFNGKIFKPRIYNRVLTGDEIARRATGAQPAHTAGGNIPFGVINAAEADFTNVGSFFGTVPVADADYRSGFNIDGSGSMSTNATAEWPLLPWAITPDEYSRGEYAVRVFARVEIASTQIDVNVVASCAPEGGTNYGARRYTQEWGSSGKAIPATSAGTDFRNVFLGTLVMRVDRDRPVRWRLKLDCTNSASSTGAFGIDTIILVPARRYVASITGVNDANFAKFIASVSQTTKRVKWNKRCEVSDPASAISTHPYPDGGLGGSNILLPPGQVQLLAWLTDYQPDRADSNSDGAGESVSATIQASVKPQHIFARA